MKQVECIEGWQLRWAWYVTEWLNGRIEGAVHGVYRWRPRPGDKLYYIGRGKKYGSEVDYYLLRRPDGEDVYLACVRTSYGQSFLDTIIGDMIPQWVLDEVQSAT